MKALLDINGKNLEVDFSKGKDISIPLDFNGNQPNTYGVKKAYAEPYQDDQFIGDTRQGGPCNFETYTFTTHCNGTHTECIGHITKERISLLSCLRQEMILATLVSVTPKNTQENYTPEIKPYDSLITKEDLELQLKHVDSDFLQAVVIRTLPNSELKKSRDYMKFAPSFFSTEAMEYIVSLGVRHLLVDTPSVDRLFDEGCLSSHNIFWETKEKEFNLNSMSKTITELIFVSEKIKDGIYLLNLQVPSFVSDAAPSRPILYKLNEL